MAGSTPELRPAGGRIAGVVAIAGEPTIWQKLGSGRAEEALQLAFDTGAIIGLWEWDMVTGRLTGDTRFAGFFSLDPQAVAKGVAMDVLRRSIHPEDAAAAELPRGRTPHAGDRYRVEYRVARPDRSYRWVEASGAYRSDESGKPTGILGILTDLTDRKTASRSEWESEERFRSLVEAVPHHVWAASPDGQLDWFNARVYEYTGAAAGELDGEKWGRVVHPADIAQATQAWTSAVRDGTVYGTEFRIRRAGDPGEYRSFLVRGVPVRDASGGIVRWIGTNTDIQDQKASAGELAQLNVTLEQRVQERTEQLFASQTQLRTFYDNSSESHALMMALPDGSFVYEDANPAVLKLYGLTREQVIGHTTDELFGPGAVEVNVHLARCLQARGPYRYERVQGGAIVEAVCTAVPIVEGEFFQRLVVTARDVTESRGLEEQLRQSQKMEAVGQLTGGLAHDFNNLLQGIVGSLDLIQKRIRQGRIADLDRFIHGAIASSSRAAALTHRLLAFSRRQPLDPRPVNAGQLIGSLEDLLRRTMGERIDIDFVVSPGLWFTLCDPNQLESALLNLAINARDAMPDGGRLTIETANFHLESVSAARQHEVEPGQYVGLSVTDTGTGMPPGVVARAFEPFFTTKPTGHGTGLGLSMIYGFIRQSEGHIKIYSELGNGTSVKLYLPRFSGPAEAEIAIKEATTTRAEDGEVVLVVEDEEVVRGLIVEVLHDLGYRALEAADGPSGLAILQSSQHIDLLVTDVGLPGLNGRQIADAARKHRAKLKVLFMTGYAENAAVPRGFLEAGMELITKPFAMETLAARIRDILAT